ncbi:hypothetical protein [Aquabacterium sp.]|uniref:hypothetical protein n=1 Tax=Aquabacterium sp. TaxID=1872578 RepID=UPI0025C59EC1|nr:hypothetical protein [Aquabacterium sp.]
MPYYAQLNEAGVCTAVTETAGEIDAPHMVAVDSLDAALLGQTYANGVFTAPVIAPAPRYLTRLAFISRFTDAEAVGIDLASIGATAQAAGMRRYMNKVDAATYIDPQRADTRAGVQALEAGGLLAAGRALQILDAPVADEELYRA